MRAPVKIDELMEEWSKDSAIDETDINRELARIPKLHSKYLNILTHHTLIVKKHMSDYYKLKTRKFEYYKGDFSQEDYEETGWEIFVKKTGRDVNMYLDSDEDLNNILLKKIMHEEIVEYCKSVLKELNSRTWQLKSYIDYERFLRGG